MFLVAIITFITVLILSQTRKFLYLGYVCVLGFISVVSFLVHQTYGPIDFTFCLSTYYSNLTEASSYINSVGYASFGIALAYIVIVILCVRISNANRVEINRRGYIVLLSVLVFLNLALSIRVIRINKPKFNALENYSYIFFTPVLKVAVDLYYNISNVRLYLATQDRMLDNFSKNNDFAFTDSELDKEIYVVVVGESVSKDYMHAYNVKAPNNTPFIENSPNIKFENYIAPACNTVNSLTKILTFNDSKSSIINLLKKTKNGKVAWISSQAQIGLHENPVSAFALQADTTAFLPSKLDVVSDFEAVKYVPKLGRRYKVVFVHIFGSHPNPCDRLRGTGLTSDIDCYSETISKLDSQMEYLDRYLKSNFKSYKLFYFSDHGVVNNGGKIVHGAKKSAYDVPMLVWSDDIVSKKTIKSPRTGNDAPNLWEEFFDIDAQDIKSNYKFISDDSPAQRIFVLDNYKKKIPYEKLK